MQHRVLSVALGLNATMFVVSLIAGLVAQSTGLIADSLDMLADAAAYSIELSAVHRDDLFKARAPSVSGGVFLVLGIGVLLDAIRRGLLGSAPEREIMMTIASISLVVKSSVIYLLGRYRDGEVIYAPHGSLRVST